MKTLRLLMMVGLILGSSSGALAHSGSEDCSSTLENRPLFQNYLKPGIYRGLTPTDESAARMGEIELHVTKGPILMRIATGHEIQEHPFRVTDYVPLSREEMAELFEENGIEESMEDSVAFRHQNGEGPTFLFAKRGNWMGPKAILFMGMADYLGPTFLFSPTQRRFLLNWTLLQVVELFHRGQRAPGEKRVIPRLRYGGTTGSR